MHKSPALEGGRYNGVDFDLGQRGGEKRKTLRAKVLGGSQKIFWETRKAL